MKYQHASYASLRYIRAQQIEGIKILLVVTLGGLRFKIESMGRGNAMLIPPKGKAITFRSVTAALRHINNQHTDQPMETSE